MQPRWVNSVQYIDNNNNNNNNNNDNNNNNKNNNNNNNNNNGDNHRINKITNSIFLGPFKYNILPFYPPPPPHSYTFSWILKHCSYGSQRLPSPPQRCKIIFEWPLWLFSKTLYMYIQCSFTCCKKLLCHVRLVYTLFTLVIPLGSSHSTIHTTHFVHIKVSTIWYKVASATTWSQKSWKSPVCSSYHVVAADSLLQTYTCAKDLDWIT